MKYLFNLKCFHINVVAHMPHNFIVGGYVIFITYASITFSKSGFNFKIIKTKNLKYFSSKLFKKYSKMKNF